MIYVIQQLSLRVVYFGVDFVTHVCLLIVSFDLFTTLPWSVYHTLWKFVNCMVLCSSLSFQFDYHYPIKFEDRIISVQHSQNISAHDVDYVK